jgi:AcrR family transcriptional regulator
VSNTFASRRSANRRRRSEAREQILDVARRELQIKPFRELGVDELMQATGLSRTAFYRYFPDREAVLVDLLEEVWGALADARDVETATEGMASASSMVGLTQLLSENRHVLKAIADAAPGDEDVEQAYRSFMHSYWIEDLTARIADAQGQGLATGLDPELAGEALGWMAERLVTQSLERDPHEVLDTIIAIVAKCIYSGPIGGGGSGAAGASGQAGSSGQPGSPGQAGGVGAAGAGARGGSAPNGEVAARSDDVKPETRRSSGRRRAGAKRDGTAPGSDES